MLAKIPFGRSKIAGFAAALWFLKEEARSIGVEDDTLVEKIFIDYAKENGIEFNSLDESFQCSETIKPGEYTLNDKKLVIEEELEPIDFVIGIPVFRLQDEVFSEEDLKWKLQKNF